MLKDAFLKRLVLCYPDMDLPFFVMTDASLVASGAILMQKDGNGDLHPCTYYSKTFTPAERNYNIYDCELLAVIQALEEHETPCHHHHGSLELDVFQVSSESLPTTG